MGYMIIYESRNFEERKKTSGARMYRRLHSFGRQSLREMGEYILIQKSFLDEDVMFITIIASDLLKLKDKKIRNIAGGYIVSSSKTGK